MNLKEQATQAYRIQKAEQDEQETERRAQAGKLLIARISGAFDADPERITLDTSEPTVSAEIDGCHFIDRLQTPQDRSLGIGRLSCRC